MPGDKGTAPRGETFMLRVRSPQDLGAGLLFIAIGGLGLYLARDLTYGSARNMGPGFFPTWLSGLVLLLGIVTAVRSFTLTGPPIGKLNLRPLLVVLAAVTVGGYLIDRVGLALALVTMTLVAGLARADARWHEVALLGVGMAVAAVVVFVYLLGQPMPAWWGRG